MALEPEEMKEHALVALTYIQLSNSKSPDAKKDREWLLSQYTHEEIQEGAFTLLHLLLGLEAQRKHISLEDHIDSVRKVALRRLNINPKK